ncbi:cell wall-binding protein [Oribacterium sp. HCP28S3_H8]|uniref:cell wall-binding protein n=1 Tax=Oribacterium sp. HCP28S3_H8 TaxID=3438945 RepID=UPI003F8C619E
MRFFFKRAIAAMLTAFAIGNIAAVPATAKDRWVQTDGSWYFYIDPEVIPENYQAEPFNGWIHADTEIWYYCVNSRMITGWAPVNGKWYYFNTDGVMLKNQWVGAFYLGEDGAVLTDTTTPDGSKVDAYGSKLIHGKPVESLNEKTARYVEVLKQHPDATVTFGSPATIVRDTRNNYNFVTYKAMTLYDKKTGEQLYTGDGCFQTNAILEKYVNDSIIKIRPMDLISDMYLSGSRIYTDPAGFITYVEH